jgi:hypothetical protein
LDGANVKSNDRLSSRDWASRATLSYNPTPFVDQTQTKKANWHSTKRNLESLSCQTFSRLPSGKCIKLCLSRSFFDGTTGCMLFLHFSYAQRLDLVPL